MNAFIKQSRHPRFFLTILVSTLLFSCSTQKPIKSTPTVVKAPSELSSQLPQEQTAQDKLNQAQALTQQLATKEQNTEINHLLLAASELFLQEQNYPKALWLADKASAFVASNEAIYRLLLVKAASLQALNYSEQAYQQLQLAKELVSTNAIEQPNGSKLTLTLPYYQILYPILIEKSQPVAAVSAQLTAFAMNEHAKEQDVEQIWQQLKVLTPWQLKLVAKSKPPLFKGWQQLLQYSHKFAANPAQFSRYLSLWQQRYPTHPASVIVQSLVNTELTVEQIENIAVLLPLSGNQAKAGIAAQQGILAAYKNNPAVNIHFVDTNQLDWLTLAEQFNQLAIDHIIGPLLKKNVESFLTQSSEHIALQVPTLLLNVPQQQTLASYQSVLSMRPETEAQQAAAILSQQNYQAPIILSHQDKVSKRIASAFSKQWQVNTGKPVDIIYFDQGKQMQANLKASLDVDTSQTRINLLNSKLKQTIKAEARNRRDIDMIYLIGSAAQTRLIKPYIDVNTSPFAQVIPVYASSRSHSNFNDRNNKDSISDLENLTFTQMPWLLNSKQQNKSLAQLSQQLWPRRSDSLAQIFAMGFDSYQLLNKIPLMQQAPYIHHYGQTGILQLNGQNIITRSLVWGRYQQDRVTEIAMD